VNLDIFEGEFVAIIGHNGSGKSTLARMLNGLFPPAKGEVLIDGVSTKNEREFKAVRSSIGMVFQNPDNQLIASRVEDDVAFGPENLAVPREEIVERVNWALGAVDMLGEADSTPHRLSGGQKQRVAIAGVLALKPRILVLDESTAMLDPQGRAEVMRVAKELNKNGMTVILITHFMEEALAADKLIVMNEGKIVSQGIPAQVFADYNRLSEIALSIPPATELAHELGALGINLPENIMTEEELATAIKNLL